MKNFSLPTFLFGLVLGAFVVSLSFFLWFFVLVPEGALDEEIDVEEEIVSGALEMVPDASGGDERVAFTYDEMTDDIDSVFYPYVEMKEQQCVYVTREVPDEYIGEWGLVTEDVYDSSEFSQMLSAHLTFHADVNQGAFIEGLRSYAEDQWHITSVCDFEEKLFAQFMGENGLVLLVEWVDDRVIPYPVQEVSPFTGLGVYFDKSLEAFIAVNAAGSVFTTHWDVWQLNDEQYQMELLETCWLHSGILADPHVLQLECEPLFEM